MISNTAIYLFFFTFEGTDTNTIAVGATVISSTSSTVHGTKEYAPLDQDILAPIRG